MFWDYFRLLNNQLFDNLKLKKVFVEFKLKVIVNKSDSLKIMFCIDF